MLNFELFVDFQNRIHAVTGLDRLATFIYRGLILDSIQDIRIAASLLQVLQKEEIVAALSSLELLQRLPFGNSLELTVAGALDKAMWTGLDFSTAVACTKVLSPAGLYALCERAELSCLQLSTAMALALLYCLDSFEHCVVWSSPWWSVVARTAS